MSARRKNAKRLKLLRDAGIPIDGDYRLTSEWNGRPAGQRIEPRDQRLMYDRIRARQRARQEEAA